MAFRYKNILRLQGDTETVRESMSAVLSDNCMDFDKITPVPVWAERYCESWAIEHWGVPQNAEPADENEPYRAFNLTVFYTHGSDVRELMRKFSMMYPGLTADYLWASEDIGQDAGMAQFKDGTLTNELVPQPDSKTAYELSFDVFGTSAGAHGLALDVDTGTYRRALGWEGGDECRT